MSSADEDTRRGDENSKGGGGPGQNSLSNSTCNGNGEENGGSAHPKGNAHPPNPPPTQEDPFAEYLWMEDMEAYDAQILRQLDDDFLIDQYSDLYEDSLLEDGTPGPTTAGLVVIDHHHLHNGPLHYMEPLESHQRHHSALDEVANQFNRSMNLTGSSRLNPNAAEFVPKSYGNIYQN